MKSKIRPSIRKRRQRYKLIAILLLITPLLVYGSVKSVDKSCGLDYPDLSTLEAQRGEPAKENPVKMIPVYDIGLPEDLQKFTYEKCMEYDVDHLMVLAIMQQESSYNPDVVSDGNYGLMQIHKSNHKYLKEHLGTTDILDPRQNIEAGIFWLQGIYASNNDPDKILMAYNMGGRLAQELWDRGITSTVYSREVLEIMDQIEGKKVNL